MSNTPTTFYNPAFEKPQPGVYNPPMNRHFIAISTINFSKTFIRKIMGQNGKAFKAISHQTGADYIFYNNDRQLIEIYGLEHTIHNAYNRLQKRIHDFEEYNRVRKQQYEERKKLENVENVENEENGENGENGENVEDMEI